MSLINLNCPHCGGLFALDSNRPLQTYWTCPYCSNRSLMQLIDGQIRLRGILRVQPEQPSSADHANKLPADDSPSILHKPAAVEEFAGGIFNPADTPIPQAVKVPIAPVPLRPIGHPLEAMVHPAAERTVQPTFLEKPVPRTWPDQPTSAPQKKPDAPTEPNLPSHAVNGGPSRSNAADRPIPQAWMEKPTAQAWPPPEPAPVSQPVHRSLSDYIAEVDAVPPKPSSKPAYAPANEPDQVIPSLEFEPPIVRPSPDVRPDDLMLADLIEQMERTARTHQLPRFNAISRKISDAVPEDPRTYTWRALLIEEADGFARATWATPWWYLLTPRQKATQIAQHFYTLNTALQFSKPLEREQLINQVADLLVRQAVDHLTEKAQIRCGKRLFRFRKTFRGRYHKTDLREAADYCDAISRIDSRICPLAYDQLVEAVRKSASFRPKMLARSLSRF